MRTEKGLQVPLLLPAVCLLAGIVATPMSSGRGLVLVALCVGTVLAWALRRWPAMQSLGVHLCCFFLGMLVAGPADRPVTTERQTVTGVVFSEPAEKPKTIAVDVCLPDAGTTVRCYLWKDAQSRRVALGSRLVLANGAGGFVRSGDWHFGGDGYERLSAFDGLRLWFLQVRHRLLENYRRQRAEDETYAVLAAMTLGDKSALTGELRDAYSVTGASHVLALSGLHLGIIWLLLFRLTLGRRRWWLSQVLIILGIWAFAFLTGLSTSVLRSAAMLSTYALFSVGGRRRSPVNLLCFTAIVMLLVSPSSVYDVGFQLSFCSVLSILLLLPLFKACFPDGYFLRHRFQKWLFGMAGLSLAAQVGVAPLIAYHFGRFSTYFLLTNFIVVPAATLILYGALLMVVMPGVVGPVLLWVVEMLNKALGWVSQLPCSSIDGLHPSVLQVCLTYLIFLCLYLAARRVVHVEPVT